MALSMQEVNAKLDSVHTEAELRNLINQLDINAGGRVTILYGGSVGDGIESAANQDGVSQANELKTLSDLGIASIKVSASASSINLGNGNTQPFSGSFTRIDDSTGESGVAEVTGSLLLANNNFYRQFTDDPTLTAEALNLPQMTGSGVVRDLRPAMSLGTAQALDLQGKGEDNAIKSLASFACKSWSIAPLYERLALKATIQCLPSQLARQGMCRNRKSIATHAFKHCAKRLSTAQSHFLKTNSSAYTMPVTLKTRDAQLNIAAATK